uniref:Uncharacterized protein n=1 Tax=Kalanchoe fedtschenkoi TaxID=63787 RepID=A0A7N0TY02_KALFE
MVAKDEKVDAASPAQAELKKGPWKPEEDMLLIEYVKKHGERDWNMVRKHSGLARCGKSCRLRWNNHLRPNLRKGPFSPDEEKLICELHSQMGNKWARIAAMLPGRTDNEIKNFWNTRVKRLARKGVPLYPADVQSPRPDLLNPYLHHLDAQNNASSSSLSTSSSSNLQLHPPALLSPTTPTSHPLLFPPSASSQTFQDYDVGLQDSMAMYDAALENFRQQQQQQQMFASAMMNDAPSPQLTSSLQRFKRHRSVPNLTISVPPVRHVALHPFSPLGLSTSSSSPMGRSVSVAGSPTTTTSYMHVASSPHSYASSPTGMVLSPTALQLGISMPQPAMRLPLSSSPVVNCRPTYLPRTSSFSFDPMLFDLNPAAAQVTHMQNPTQTLDAIDNELAFSVEDLGISMDHETTGIPPNQPSYHVNGPQQMQTANCNNAGLLDEFLKEAETISIRGEEKAEFSAEQAEAFLKELESDWEQSRLDCSTSGQASMDKPEAQTVREYQMESSMAEPELNNELSNLLEANPMDHSFWNDGSDGLDLGCNNGTPKSQASQPSDDNDHHHQYYQLNHFIDDHLGMEMHQLTGSVPVGASPTWDNMPGIY